jgi:ketosteroid isomerase-like protein
VDVVREAMDAYFRGDEAGMLSLVAPDVVATQFPDQLDVRDYRGHDGLRELMADWIGTWEDWTIEILAVREEAGGHVLVTARQRGRGRASGAPMEADVVFVFTVRGAAIARWQMFHSEAEALQAIGPED